MELGKRLQEYLTAKAKRLEDKIRQVISNQCERFVLPYNPFAGL